MIFVYRTWERFCRRLHENGLHSISADRVREAEGRYIVLKHDVETDVSKAYRMACIEEKYGHIGSYYVQAYLLEREANVALLQRMRQMGHEISYHYDVMDSCGGDIGKAIAEFEKNKQAFEKHGFELHTVCQHGNPIVERKGYTSNRDFFRSERVREKYPSLSDIMVNFGEMHRTEYRYYSDAGRQFKYIYDPLTNDIVNSDAQNEIYRDLGEVLASLGDGNAIISTHPHRWSRSALLYVIRAAVFRVVRCAAKLLIRIPLCRRIMSRYYYLAKKL